MTSEKEEVMSAEGSPDGKTRVVAVVEVPTYEGLDEARAALGDLTVLALTNLQNGTNIKNAARKAATSRPSKQWFSDKATEELFKDPSTVALLASDPTQFPIQRDKKVKELEAAYDAGRAAKAAELAKDTPQAA